MGTNRGGRVTLAVEEVLWLLETVKVRLIVRRAVASFQQALNLLDDDDDMTWEEYCVYAALKRSGRVVLRTRKERVPLQVLVGASSSAAISGKAQGEPSETREAASAAEASDDANASAPPPSKRLRRSARATRNATPPTSASTTATSASASTAAVSAAASATTSTAPTASASHAFASAALLDAPPARKRPLRIAFDMYIELVANFKMSAAGKEMHPDYCIVVCDFYEVRK